MRTTLTLDPDVARLIEEEAHRQRKPIKQIVNAALRRGLVPPDQPREPYRVRPHRTSLSPHADAGSSYPPQNLNELADHLEQQGVVPQLRTGS